MGAKRAGLGGLGLGFVLSGLCASSAAYAEDWTLASTITRAAMSADASYGHAVSVSETTVMAGAAYESSNGFNRNGAAYIYSGAGWTDVTRLIASDDRDYAGIGSSVGVGGDSAFSGNGRIDMSTVYVFGLVSGKWTQTQILKEDASSTFGWEIIVQGAQALLSAPKDSADIGKLHIYGKSGGMWSEQQEIIPSDPTPGDFFGLGVDFDGDSIAAVAPGTNSGRAATAYVYAISGGKFVEQAKLPQTGAPAVGAGGDVSLSGDIMLVPATPGVGMKNNGEVRVYTRAAGNWSLTQTLTMPSEDFFGTSVKVRGDTAWVAGRTGDQGTVYIYTRGASGFTLSKTLALPGKSAEATVTVSGGTLVVGVPDDGASGYVQVYRNPSADVAAASASSGSKKSGCGIATRGAGESGSEWLIGVGVGAWVVRRKRQGRA